jgi:hypothetical protein
MFSEVLVLLKEKLDAYFKLKANTPEDKVAFLDGSKMDPISFPLNKVTPLIINIEEEKMLRPGNRYEGVISNGIKTQFNPAVSLNLQVLFVSRFADYQQSLKFLSLIIRFFQRNRVFNKQNSPALAAGIDTLRIELLTMPLAQQNSIWSSLRTTYLPSVLYKVSMLVFNDDESTEAVNEVKDIHINVARFAE